MKYLFIGLLLLFPFVSSAATLTASQRATLETELQTLETELIAILSTQTTEPSGALGTASLRTEASEGTTGTVTASVGSTQPYVSAEGALFNIPVTINNETGSPIYVPTNMTEVPTVTTTSNAPGMAYTIIAGQDSIAFAGTENASISCPSLADLNEQTGYYEACEVAAGQSVQMTAQIIPIATKQGVYAITLDSMDYTSTTSDSPFTIIPFQANETNQLYF